MDHDFNLEALLQDFPDLDVSFPDQGRTALHLASQYNHFEKVELLLACLRIDVNVQDSLGRTPLFVAVEFGADSRLICALLGVEGVEAGLSDCRGRTPLWETCRQGDLELVELLRASAKDLDLNKKVCGDRADDGLIYSALEIAQQSSYPDVVSHLEKFVVNPEITRHELQVTLGRPEALAGLCRFL